MYDFLMTVVMLAIIALVLGAGMIWRAGDRRRAVLMVIAAVVLAGNVAVWILPVSGRGTAPKSVSGSVVEGPGPGH